MVPGLPVRKAVSITVPLAAALHPFLSGLQGLPDVWADAPQVPTVDRGEAAADPEDSAGPGRAVSMAPVQAALTVLVEQGADPASTVPDPADLTAPVQAASMAPEEQGADPALGLVQAETDPAAAVPEEERPRPRRCFPKARVRPKNHSRLKKPFTNAGNRRWRRSSSRLKRR
ncbi:hypothetical protein FACS1894141_2360 [Spirochaetia bacterium]|nr:hypothetical protein FACS1894141_2360 [Spirochaetia bacterium]